MSKTRLVMAGLISYPVLQKILDVIGVGAEDWGFEPQLEPEMKPEEDIDDLIWKRSRIGSQLLSVVV